MNTYIEIINNYTSFFVHRGYFTYFSVVAPLKHNRTFNFIQIASEYFIDFNLKIT